MKKEIKSRMNLTSDAFLARAKSWAKEFEQLRLIVLEYPFTEELKWGWPCYSLENKNVVLIHGFKEYCALLFFKGALLKDPAGILVRPGENSQASRQIRFTNVREITKRKSVLKSYIAAAIETEKAGLKVKLKKAADFKVPEEFQIKLQASAAVKAAFAALTPGRQKAYLLYFSSAKQSKTRESRIEKCLPQILDGKGLND